MPEESPPPGPVPGYPPPEYPPPPPVGQPTPAQAPPSGYGPPPGWAPAPPPSAPTGRSTHRVFLVGVVVVLVAAAAAAGIWVASRGTPAATQAESKALETKAVAAAERQGSFHYVASSTAVGNDQTIIGDAAANNGRQNITSNGDSFQVRVVGASCFFNGDVNSMVQNLGISPTAAAKGAGKWVSLATSDAPYKSVYAAVTVSSALSDNITFVPKSELAPGTIGGQRVIGIRGPITGIDGVVSKGTAVLYVTDDSRHLPVRYVEKGTVGSGTNQTPLDFTMDFSAWGESVSVSAPSQPIPFTSLGGGSGGTIPGTTIVA